MKKRNWIKTTIAMITLIATVLETGFSTVSTMAAEITTEDGIVVNTDALGEASEAEDADDGLQIEVVPDDASGEGSDAAAETAEPEEDEEEEAVTEDGGSVEASSEDAEAEDTETEDTETEETEETEDFQESEEAAEEEEVYEEAPELKNGTLNLSDTGITGSGYKEISVYVDTDKLAKKDTFRIEFSGPATASYNPVINEDLDKTNGGRYDFEGLEGGEFTVRASASDNVILSYKYNEDGYPMIDVESKPSEGTLDATTLKGADDSEISAIRGEGYDNVEIRFNTEGLSDKAKFAFFVESEADATVDGKDAKEGITGLSSDTKLLTIDNLEGESFNAYVLADGDKEIDAKAEVDGGEATINVKDVAVKREYKYEDSKAKVTATLEKADAIPDDAYFCVTPLTEEEAEKYLEVLNSEREDGTPEYT
ncbi:MAG: hypothetical protein K6G58_04115, partial [Lachnospiraceae bacterium]|nr:hypothetical protein [Lachnospiraceae bacterium]